MSRHPKQVFFIFFEFFYFFPKKKQSSYSWGVKTAVCKISRFIDENPWRNSSSKLNVFGPFFQKRIVHWISATCISDAFFLFFMTFPKIIINHYYFDSLVCWKFWSYYLKSSSQQIILTAPLCSIRHSPSNIFLQMFPVSCHFLDF